MAKKVIPLVAIGLAAVLAFVVVFDIVRGDSGGGGFDEDARHRGELLVNAGEKLRAAGTASVAFQADLRTDIGTGKVAWTGTSRLSYAGTPRSETEYTEVKSDAGATVRARRVIDDGDAYYTSPSFVPADRRPWITPSRTAMFWPDPLSDPELGLPDYPTWQAVIGGIPLDRAIAARTEDLDDLEGAPYEYRFVCTDNSDEGCVTSFGTALDQYFNVVPIVDLAIWLDEEGRPRRVSVKSTLEWRSELARAGEAQPPYRTGVYEFGGRFDLSGFGSTPVTAEAPPAGQVSGVRVVSAKK
jgi:hypothetical protein